MYYALLVVLLACSVAQLRYHRHVLARAFDWKRPRTPRGTPPVSIIVCYRNEAARLGDCIAAILRQDYPDFELLLVDDNSTDDGAAVARSFADPRLRHLTPGPTRTGKKDALAYGIRQARHDIFLLTDADCRPLSDQWVRLMTEPISAGVELCLGVSPYAGGPSWLHRWQRFEATYTALQYLGYAYRKRPYMGVGRNLAYTRKFFGRAGGFAAHAHLPGGDDDLLVSAAARADRTKRVLDPAGWVHSAPSDSWATYFRRKIRHQSVGTAYPAGIARQLAGLGLSHGGWYLSALGLLLMGAFGTCVLALLFRLWLVAETYLGDRQKLMTGRLPFWQCCLFDAALAPFYLFLAVATLLAPRSW